MDAETEARSPTRKDSSRAGGRREPKKGPQRVLRAFQAVSGGNYSSSGATYLPTFCRSTLNTSTELGAMALLPCSP